MENKQQRALTKIALTPKGRERAKLLQDDDFRKLVLSSGANVTIYSGEIDLSATTPSKKLENIQIGLIQRKNKKGKFDGLGALGGLAERTNEAYFNQLSEEEKLNLIGQKDDVILQDGKPILTTDINIIRKNNVLREMREELENLNIFDITIDSSKLELIPMNKVKDDNYMINIWDGNGECFAITPYCHLYKDEDGLIDTINQNAKEQIGGEASEYKKVPLLKALSSYGNMTKSEHALEDGRDALKDYRYPHEYLASWALASKLLEHDDNQMIELAKSVQQNANHLISFEKIASSSSIEMKDIAEILKIKPETLNKMEEAFKNTFSQNKQILQNHKFNSSQR